MVIENYRDLKVWQLGIEVTTDIYPLAASFPKHEIYALTSQICRAAVSIPANIAEGHERRSTKEFLHFLSIVQGSRGELETLLHIATLLSYCSAAQAEPLFAKLTELGKMLRGLQKALKRRL
jgi:four helix bundle protein